MKPMMRPQAFVPSQAYPVRIWEGDGSPDSQKTDVLAEETPVALVYNGISHVVMPVSYTHLQAHCGE